MNDVINTFGEVVKLSRFAAGQWVDGNWVETVADEFDIVANVQPLTDKEIETELSTAGQDTRNGIKIYTEVELRPSSEKDRSNADQIEWRGDLYIIQSVQIRDQIAELAHYKAIGLLKDS